MLKPLLPLTVLKIYSDAETSLTGMTRLQKSVFLVQHQLDGPECYSYTAGKYGPISSGLYTDLQELIKRDFVTKTEVERTVCLMQGVVINEKQTRYSITSKGTNVIENAINDGVFEYNYLEVSEFINREMSKQIDEIIAMTHDLSPELFEGRTGEYIAWSTKTRA